MSKKIVFLHGVGDGDNDLNWLSGLNQGLATAGVDEVSEADVIRPNYSTLLNIAGLKLKHPTVTYKIKDDAPDRRAFIRRQARIERLLENADLAKGFGFKKIPDVVMGHLQHVGINSPQLKQVHNYMSEEGLRAAVLSHILGALPKKGEIVLIGHSLGSIIAIDLIDHLPENLHVSRFITIGSPGSAQILHDKHERILKRFPYARVDDWTNLFSPKDPVTAGRGLASVFPGAQDFRIDIPYSTSNPIAHNAKQYLAHPAVGMLVADALRPPVDVPVTGKEVAVRLEDSDFDALFTLTFGLRVASKVSKKEPAARYADTLKVLGDEYVDAVRQRLSMGSSLPVEVATLARGEAPQFPDRLSLDEAVRRVVVAAFANVIQPYEIEVGNAQLDAIPDFFADIGHTTGYGEIVREAIIEVQKVLNGSGGFTFPAGRFALAAAGVALIAAGPIGIATMGTAAGAAAITSGLAAFGPGGMVGGLALLSGLASTGAMVTTAAATVKNGDTTATSDPATLALHIATSYALKRVGEQPDPHLWAKLTAAEGFVSDRINKLAEFSDSKAPNLAQFVQTRTIINRLMAFTHDAGMGLNAIEQPE